MSNSDKFEKYVAAVSMASLASNGSGDLNPFDHVAKDLHEEGFLERMENLSEQSIRYLRSKHEEWLDSEVAMKYDETDFPISYTNE